MSRLTPSGLTWLVAERELRESLRRKGVKITFLLLLLGGLALVILPEVLPGEDRSRDVLTVGAVPAEVRERLVAAAESADFEFDVTIVEGPDPLAAATSAVKEGDADLALVWDGDATRILVRTGAADIGLSLTQQVIHSVRSEQVFADAGVDPGLLGAVAALPRVPVEVVDVERGGREGAAFGLTIAMYMVIVILASAVASSVATEKASRVSEVLLAVVPVRSLLYGKVIGVGLLGFSMALVGATPLLVKSIAGGDLPEGLGTTLASSGAWLVGGIVMYLLIAAMLGALADRTEDVGGIVTPLTLGLVIIYVAALSSIEKPLGMVLSIVPLSAPIAMPARMAIGAATWWQIALSLVLLAVAVVAIGRFAAVIYARAIVRTGRRVKLREVLGARDTTERV